MGKVFFDVGVPLDGAIVKAVFERAGAYVLGRRMFEEGEASWPEETPVGTPVFVLTHHAREPWLNTPPVTHLRYHVARG
ncbi:MAG TPA: hypothetical protein VMN56_14465 [Casimicrobiaceae bacterium]|nr:hypothetical protein [Casimicrobiaceae bacterium]